MFRRPEYSFFLKIPSPYFWFRRASCQTLPCMGGEIVRATVLYCTPHKLCAGWPRVIAKNRLAFGLYSRRSENMKICPVPRKISESKVPVSISSVTMCFPALELGSESLPLCCQVDDKNQETDITDRLQKIRLQ